MNTKALVTTSAILMGVSGLILSFLPQEVLTYPGLTGVNPIIMQILGAPFFGFAMLNPAVKTNLTGGIYNRPIAISNFTHFLIGGLALDKLVFNNTTSTCTWIAEIVYSIFAVLFGYVLFINPVLKNKTI
ncbi:MAG: hypothetical protein ABI402_13335 [Ferruginibacter sp.]